MKQLICGDFLEMLRQESVLNHIMKELLRTGQISWPARIKLGEERQENSRMAVS